MPMTFSNSRKRFCIFSFKQQSFSGMTLLEVLLALSIMSIGMLGIAHLFLVSYKAVSSSYLKQQANQCVQSILERMRGNAAAAAAGNYNLNNLSSGNAPAIPSPPSVSCLSSTCSPSQMAAYDMWYWLANTVGLLPGGSGSITTTGSGKVGSTSVTVIVQWNDSPAQSILGRSSNIGSANPNFVQISVQSQL